MLFVLVFACSSVFISSSFVLAQEVGSKEMLMFTEVPTVITATRRAQPITKAPAFVVVVTGDEIRRSGATNLPEALRMVPGLDVFQAGSSNTQVAIRGFSAPLSDKAVVMVDGRSVYLDLENVVLWENNVLSMDDIDHIEIVEGPVSPLYGANAFSGVINIITKTPEQAKGTYLSTSMTSPVDGYTGRLLQGGVSENGDLAYKLAFNWQTANDWSARTKRDLDTMMGYGLLEYRMDKDKKFSFSGGRSDSPKFEMTTYGIETKMARQYFKAGYDQPNLFFHVYQDIMRATIVYGSGTVLEQSFKVADVTTDAEFQHSLDWGLKNALVWGLNFHHTYINAPVLLDPAKITLDRLAIYFQNEYKMQDNLSIFVGGRLDKDDMSEKELLSPMASGVYSPTKNQTWRLTYGKAFKLPAIANAFVAFHAIDQNFGPFGILPLWEMLPNSELRPESVTNYELGYQAKPSSRAKFFANLHYSTAKDLIAQEREPPTYPYGGYGYFGPLFKDYFVNQWKATAIGGEIGLDYLLTDWLTGSINYAYIDVKDITNHRDYKASPKNKVNIGFSADWKNGLNANLTCHYIDTTLWSNSLASYPVAGRLFLKNDPYFLVNTRVGYRFNKDSMEVAFAVYNLFDDKHYEYPESPSAGAPGGDQLRRQVTASFNYKF
jgi:iron complex outermembrane receptor protein